MNKSYYIPQIQEIAKDVAVGDTARCVCPLCEGGSTREKSLSVTRRSSTEASYYCFRAKCSLGGGHIAVFSGTDGSVLKYNSKTPSSNNVSVNLTSLDQECIDFFSNRYGITPALLSYGRFQATLDRRIYMPIFDPLRRKRGSSTRKYKKLYQGRREYASIPKALISMNDTSDVPLSWYYKGRFSTNNSNTVILVEDILSALRLVPYVDAVSLMGTSFGVPKQQEIRLRGHERVIMALDEDATEKAIAYKKRTKLMLPNMSVMFLPKDIKDMSTEELEAKLDDYSIL